MARDAYEVLQVSPLAELEVIEAAYRRLARKYHPDVSDSPDANARMKELNWAYEILRDPASRANYDLSRREQDYRRRQTVETSYEPRPPRDDEPQPAPRASPSASREPSAGSVPAAEPPAPRHRGAGYPVLAIIILAVAAAVWMAASSGGGQSADPTPTVIPSVTPEIAWPSPAPTEDTSRPNIDGLYFDLPPGWCRIDEIHITAFCPYLTNLPSAEVEFSRIETPPDNPRDAIEDFIRGFEGAGFRVTDFTYLQNIPDVDGEPVEMAYVVMIHPDHDWPAGHHLVASFQHYGQYHLLWGHLIQQTADSDFQYLYDSMISLLEGMSFSK